MLAWANRPPQDETVLSERSGWTGEWVAFRLAVQVSLRREKPVPLVVARRDVQANVVASSDGNTREGRSKLPTTSVVRGAELVAAVPRASTAADRASPTVGRPRRAFIHAGHRSDD